MGKMIIKSSIYPPITGCIFHVFIEKDMSHGAKADSSFQKVTVVSFDITRPIFSSEEKTVVMFACWQLFIFQDNISASGIIFRYTSHLFNTFLKIVNFFLPTFTTLIYSFINFLYKSIKKSIR